MARATRGQLVRRWEDVPAVVRATGRILQTHERAARTTTEAVLSIGRQIARVRDTLERGEFTRWAQQAVPFGLRTVHNYLGLAAWADQQPERVAALAHLGPSKLYRIAALPPARRRRFRARTKISMPDGPAKLLEVMTVAELDRAIGALAAPPPVEPPAVDGIVDSFRQRLTSLDAITDDLVAHADELDAEVGQALLEEVRALADRLEHALVA